MSAADMTKVALVMAHKDHILKGYGAYPVLAVHDEIILECLEEFADLASKRLEEIMIMAAQQRVQNVPFKAEGEVMDRWVKN